MDRIYIYIMDSTEKVSSMVFHNGNVPWPYWWDKKAYYSKSYSERLKFQEPGKGKIFFGPCKKDMRWEIRDYIEKHPEDNIYIVGLTNNNFQPRNIVYYMKVDEKLTFKQAYNKYPKLIGTGIHIKPMDKPVQISFNYYGKERYIELEYEHLDVFYSCKKAPHYNNWIKDIARDYTNFKKTGPDCCFMGTKDSVFFGKINIRVDEEFCKLLKKGTIFKGKLNKDAINVNNPIPNPRGNHIVLDGKPASLMIQKLENIEIDIWLEE